MKKLLKILLTIVLIAVVAAGGLFGWLTVAEYRPEEIEKVDIQGLTDLKAPVGAAARGRSNRRNCSAASWSRSWPPATT